MVDRWVGLATYKYWIWDFARLRRTPSAADMLSVYQDPLLVVWLISFATGAVLLWLPTRKRKLAELAEEALSESFSDPAASDIASGGRIWMPVLGVALMCVV